MEPNQQPPVSTANATNSSNPIPQQQQLPTAPSLLMYALAILSYCHTCDKVIEDIESGSANANGLFKVNNDNYRIQLRKYDGSETVQADQDLAKVTSEAPEEVAKAEASITAEDNGPETNEEP